MQTITRLALSGNRENKTKSILIMLSIMLTTMLLTAIAVFGYGAVRNGQVNAGRFYGSYYGVFGRVSEEALSTIRLRSEFADIGVNAIVGTVQGEEQDNLALYCMDGKARAMTNQAENLAEGYFPESGNEIAGYRTFFQAIGLAEPKVGDTVSVRYRKNQQSPYEEAQFVICGFLEEPGKAAQKMGAAFVSRDCYERLLAPEERSYTMYFTLNESIAIDGGNGEQVIADLAKSCGIDERYASDNYMYLVLTISPGTDTILGCVGAGAVVILFSLLVIYNIFQVGIARKVQEYGKIKALGTTKRQMKRLIFREGMMLAVIAVPLGLLPGYIAGKLFVESGVEHQSAMGLEPLPVSVFSLPLLLFIVLISFLTVWAALMRPMRIVAAISPVEAMRYQELPGGRRRPKGVRKGRKTMDVKGLTLANLSAHRGRTVSTIFTMGFSCVLFMVLANVGGNMDAEYEARRYVAYGDFRIDLDYSTNDTAYPENNLDAVLADNPLDEKLLDEIRQIEGVRELRTQDSLCFIRDGRLWSMAVMSEEDFERELELGSTLGDFTYEQAVEEGAVLYGWSFFMEENGFSIGQQMDLELFNGNRSVPYSGRLLGSFGGADRSFVITDQTYRSLGFAEPSCGSVWITCERGRESQVEEALRQIMAEKQHLSLVSYAKELATWEKGIGLTRNICYTLSIFIAVISFLNMTNTLITSSITRKQEFGVLQAVGMTNAQLNRSLQAEGMIFTAGTVLVTLLVGIPAGYGLFCYGKSISMMGLHNYHFPVTETLLLVIALAALQGILSFTLSRNVKKESLIDRIRYHG